MGKIDTISNITVGQIVKFVFSIPRMVMMGFANLGKTLGVTVLDGAEEFKALDDSIMTMLSHRNKLCEDLAEKGIVSRTRMNWMLIREVDTSKGESK
jgi:hypothetical protein